MIGGKVPHANVRATQLPPTAVNLTTVENSLPLSLKIRISYLYRRSVMLDRTYTWCREGRNLRILILFHEIEQQRLRETILLVVVQLEVDSSESAVRNALHALDAQSAEAHRAPVALEDVLPDGESLEAALNECRELRKEVFTTRTCADTFLKEKDKSKQSVVKPALTKKLGPQSQLRRLVTSRCHEQARPFLPPDCWRVHRYLATSRYWPALFLSFLPRALMMALRQQTMTIYFIKQPKAKTDDDVMTNNSISSVHVRCRLQPVPKFDGDILEFKSFWDQFEASDLGDITKFLHLRSCLSGAALKAIERITVCAENYSEVVRTLHNRFYRVPEVVASHVLEVVGLKDRADEAPRWLEPPLPRIESSGEGNLSGFHALLPLIKEKLPPDTLEAWRAFVQDLTNEQITSVAFPSFLLNCCLAPFTVSAKRRVQVILSDPFVANRVQDILSRTEPSQWRHCPTADNPADKLSRGCALDTLRENQRSGLAEGTRIAVAAPYHGAIAGENSSRVP
ncbi:hypothetical protein T4C_6652 [Trichinella pseudospiralis]|uniref:Uncharacterized protein n=1 Tax=Trichinella pseudospiralis TaxID=6337 RepID=A0A0V1JZU5_TRIPS|nr:hypothetical protein T4C_6652 [Trichinella pseudospiralis]